MWIFMSDGMLSVVAATEEGLVRAGLDGQDPGLWLSVRARKVEHIKAASPEVAVHTWPGRDYAARAYLPRDKVAAVVAERITATTATNFKDSVDDGPPHDAYLDVWSAMWSYQQGALEPE